MDKPVIASGGNNLLVSPVPPATPYSHSDWAHSNLERYRRSEEAKQRSEAVRNETLRLVEDRQIKTNRNQNEASNKLNDRARDITSWKKDLEKELDALLKETKNLHLTRREIEHAIAQTKRPEDVVNHCISAREYWVGKDNVTDNVQLALNEEMKEKRGSRVP